MKFSYSPPGNKLLADINQKINPNNAHWFDMMDLPGIGAEKAWAIYQYRTGHTSRAFASAKDLTNVPGIGIITAQGLQDYLEFDPDSGQE